jgi:uncharacterized membrane protein SpoIIM required for sporulation
MVLEELTNPFRAEQRPWFLLLYGFIVVTVAVFLSTWIFAEYSSLVMVFLTVLAIVPLFMNTMRMEEEKDIVLDDERSILREHRKTFAFFLFLFVGMVSAFALWYLVLPSSMTTALFTIQSQTISGLNDHVTGSVTRGALFSRIFLNNVKVLVFCLLFSFVYGMGALFILTWNASVIGVATGNFIRTQLATVTASSGMSTVGAYLYVGSLSFVRYFIHGIPEVLAYFIAGLAGGIISVALMKHDFGSKHFEKIILDTSNLTLIALGLLFVAAVIEVYITPALF